ncbi:MAG TPA: acyl-CoA dehydrogenase [Syntrophales bacterium]|nr:acyl-CoA dehydrogenase [Syntrophales bacterium]HOM07550.1 acyl-CoA dehydrogenase [Syntrophales bacterium]
MGRNLYKRDDRDLRFVLWEHLKVQGLLNLEAYRHFAREDFDLILDQAQRIAADVVAPTFQDGDRDGCRFENGKVTVPPSFHRVWQVFKEGGWFSLACNPAFGGQGLPLTVAEAAQEFFMSANFAFMCYAGMGPGNGAMIEKYGSPALKALFVPKMYDGTWCGTMCLTEPAVGSDAHLVATKASPVADDLYSIQGTKIFITSGEHDLTENIIHLVIARIEGAPPGAKGVSLFAVPKIWVNEDGSLGEPNDVTCVGIEHKMGLNGSATCVLNFGENGRCRGFLVGRPGLGLAYMFDMVNLARMAVGLESVAFGANIYANVLAYAKERVQGVPFGKTQGRVRIVEHADVRRMLMNIKAVTEGLRALVFKAYLMEDLAKAASTAEERAAAAARLGFLTPLVKAYGSDRLYELGREGIQILGGYGFTKEYPVEQYVRDGKIFSIWDGTNYIQALDLIARKIPMEGGKVFQDWLGEVKGLAARARQDDLFREEASLLGEAAAALLEVVSLYEASMKAAKTDLISLTATRFLDCVAETAVAHLLLEQAFTARERLEGGATAADLPFYEGKIMTVRYYFKNLLPQVMGRARIIKLQDDSALRVPEASL